MRIVADTNVLVSGLLRSHGPPGRLVDLLLRGELVVLFDDRILHEYRQVLSRPHLGFAAADVAALLDTLETGGEPILAEPLAVELPDPDDLPFLEVAVTGGADALVTGNLRHFPSAGLRRRLPIELPRVFLERWMKGAAAP